MRTTRPSILLLSWIATLPAVVVMGQGPCTFAYAPGEALAGVDGSVVVLTPWDPDGAGPAPMHVVVAGAFRVAGDIATPNIAAYEPVAGQWLALGQGLPGLVRTVAVRTNGNLVAAGDAGAVFEWNGSSWQQLGGSFGAGLIGGTVGAVTVMPNGDVIAGGNFTTVAGAPIYGIARWDGGSWQAMGAPTVPWSLGTVERMVLLPNGDLVAAGLFSVIGGVSCSLIARWDGAAWHPFGAGSTSIPFALTLTTTGDLIANGTFSSTTGTARFARWNGSTWVDFGVGLPMTLARLAPLPNGDVLAMGSAGIWSSNGGTWAPFVPWNPSAEDAATALALSANDLIVGGSFSPSQTVPALNLARWQGATWQAPNPGSNGSVSSVVPLPDGSFFVGGNFSTIGGQPANRLAHFDGMNWTPIASTAIGPVRYAVARPNGEVVLVGEFPNATGGIDFVMSWDGGQVTPIYGGLWGARVVRAIALADNGDVLLGYLDFAAFQAGFARWDGTTLTFTPLGIPFINTLMGLPDGDLLVAGSFNFAGTNYSLARWSGGQFTPFGAPLNATVLQLASAPNGDVIAAGGISGRIARWDGVAWQPFGAGLTDSVTSVAVLPDGDVIASERRSVYQGWLSRVWHWDGSAWTLLADTEGQADAVWSATGQVVLYGEFAKAGGEANAFLARLQPTCPAAVQDLGGGCVGAAGPLSLAVTEQAWIGGTLRTMASGLPAGALSIGVFGFAATAQPLSLLHPLGTPGCNLLVTEDILLRFDVTGGTAAPGLAVPNAMALVGAQFQHQLLGVELTAMGNVAAITSSNALLLTIGAL